MWTVTYYFLAITHTHMLDKAGIAALLPPPNTTPAPTTAPTFAPGTVSGGDGRVIFSQTDMINRNMVTESPEMRESIAALPIETVAAAPVVFEPAPTVAPSTSLGVSRIGMYIAIFAIVVFCLMLLLFISTRGKTGRGNSNFKNAPRGFDPYSL